MSTGTRMLRIMQVDSGIPTCGARQSRQHLRAADSRSRAITPNFFLGVLVVVQEIRTGGAGKLDGISARYFIGVGGDSPSVGETCRAWGMEGMELESLPDRRGNEGL